VKFDLVANRKYLYMASGLFTGLSLLLLAIPPALRPGIEFTAGTTMQVRFDRPVAEREIIDVYASLGHAEARIQAVGPTEYLVRTRELQVPPGSFTTPAAPDEAVQPIGPVPTELAGTVMLGAVGATGSVTLRQPFNGDTCTFGATSGDIAAGTTVDVIRISKDCPDGERYQVATGAVTGWVAAADTSEFAVPQSADSSKDQGERTVIENGLREQLGNFEVLEFATVSPTVSQVAVRNAAIALAVATVFILAYIALAFASVPSPLRYGVCAVVAMLHDVIITLGFFSLFGKVFGTEINLMFVTGLLTVIGFSVHDTIVIFDRIRENVRHAPQAPLHQNVNAAIMQTIARSLNTSLTVLITVAAMLALGGATIQSFLLVILIGVIAGTYSSIGIAAQLLVSWETGELARLAFWRRAETTEQVA
jgi:preprotein translocase SecF subunit